MGSRPHDHVTAISWVITSLSCLDDGWTILASPRFGLERPDVVALHPQHGVCVITVTDLRPDGVERSADGWLTYPEHPDRRLPEQPHLGAARIGAHIFDAHFADLEAPSDRARAVRWLLVAPAMDDATARRLLAARGATDADTAISVWGTGFAQHVEAAVRGQRLAATAAAADAGIVPPPLAPVNAAGLRRVLAAAVTGTAARSASPAAPIQTAAQQIVADPTGSRCRRVRGVGGSGKTFALTARAAELARAGRSVLVLSFTTTLADRLTSLIVDRCAERNADPRLVTVTNFHALCEHTVELAEAAGYASRWPEGTRWPVAIVDRARQVIEDGFDHRYDAILVDEGQDFSEEWWTMLRTHFAVPDAEMLVVVDPTQDLYRVDHWFDEATMASLDFSDPWVELPAVVRTPPDLVGAVDVVALDPGGSRRGEARTVETRRPTVASAERDHLIGPAVPSVLRWVDIDRVAELGREIGREVVRLVREHPTLTPGDVVFLCDYHHDGLAAVREIERAGIPVHHQFSRDPAGRSIRRRRFSVASPSVKGATVHGFKGWEASALVMGIGADATSVTLASVAIERVATPASGGSAIVTVVNADRSRRAGGASLARLGEQGGVAPTPGLADRPAPSSPPSSSSPSSSSPPPPPPFPSSLPSSSSPSRSRLPSPSPPFPPSPAPSSSSSSPLSAPVPALRPPVVPAPPTSSSPDGLDAPDAGGASGAGAPRPDPRPSGRRPGPKPLVASPPPPPRWPHSPPPTGASGASPALGDAAPTPSANGSAPPLAPPPRP